NFYHEKDGVRGENVLSSGGLFKLGELTLGFVGVMTPETFSKSAPAYFQDENGEFIYGLSGGDTGEELQADVQKAIDSARAQGADLVIGLGHLGLDSASEPWTSATTLSNISGMDAFIDGHSHTECEHSTITDKDGESVVLVQTGEYFHNIGLMIIDAETHEIKTELIGYNELTEKGTDENGEETDVVVGYELVSELYTGAKWPVDEQTAELKNNWITTIEESLGVVIATTELTFDNYDAEGNRISRKQATNSGDLAADALYWLFDDMGMNVDVAITNAGGLRNKAITGEITYTLCKSMHTFGNHACLRTVTGQQLLDALEWGARGIGFDDDIGAFMQVSGITFSIDPTIEPTSVCDEYEMWVSGPTGEYKVQDVQVYNKKTNAYEPLDLEAKYNLSGYDTFLTKAVDGYTMFDGTAVVMDHAMEDYLVLANYFTAFEGGVIEATNSPLLAKYPNMLLDYSDVNGSGRITILPAE
ncbi:MAG: 5'-nucleotidase C-terminal domain-containing protein, partial [Eubacteriales bacterium]|nr:5'-nucleotidase C-terminal domain-containing protein [Eubacteriales bacterium]